MSQAPGTNTQSSGELGKFLQAFGPLLGNLAPGGNSQQQPPQVIVTERRESDYTGLIFVGILLTVVLIAIFKK
jgi:hypothetical protein